MYSFRVFPNSFLKNQLSAFLFLNLFTSLRHRRIGSKMLVRLIKHVYLFSYCADIHSLLMHLPCLSCYVKANRAGYAMLVKCLIVAPKAMTRVLMPLKLAAAIARHLLQQGSTFLSFCPFINFSLFTCNIRRNFSFRTF